jgi:hypothetical protein
LYNVWTVKLKKYCIIFHKIGFMGKKNPALLQEKLSGPIIKPNPATRELEINLNRTDIAGFIIVLQLI